VSNGAINSFRSGVSASSSALDISVVPSSAAHTIEYNSTALRLTFNMSLGLIDRKVKVVSVLALIRLLQRLRLPLY